MEFLYFNAAQLKDFISSARYRSFGFLPISAHRALSQVKNPRAKADDVLLILALEEGRLAGYIGILPDDIFIEGVAVHCGWLSTIFVSESFRGKGLSSKLLNEAYNSYSGNIFMNEFTPEAEKLYLKSGKFNYVTPLQGTTFYSRFSFAGLSFFHKKKWQRIIPFLKITDTFFNLIMDFPRFFNTKESPIFSYDKEVEEFIGRQKPRGSFLKSLNEIKWILENPWVLPGKKDDKYRFSDFDDSFSYHFLKVYKDKKLTAVIMLSERQKRARIHYVFGDTGAEGIPEVLCRFLRTKKIEALLSYEKEINTQLKKKFFLYKKERLRKFFISKDFQKKDKVIDSWMVFAGDGDSIFT